MPALSSTLPNQIRFLLRSLSDANADVDSIFRELCQFIEIGAEGSILVLHTLFEHMHYFREDWKTTQLEPVFVSVFKILFDRPNFSTILCQSLRSLEINEDFLEHLSNVLHLSLCEKIGIGLALCDLEIHEAKTVAKKFCMSHIEELCSNPVPMNSAEQIQNIVMFLQCSEGLSDHVDQFLQILSSMLPKDAIPFVLTPLLSDDMHEENFLRNMDHFFDSKENEFDVLLAEMEKEMSTGDIVKELGFGCTFDASHCKDILSHFLPLTESTISKLIGSVACNYSGLEDSQSTYSNFGLALGCSIPTDLPQLSSWDIDILVKTIKQLAPGVNWVKVMEYMDHEGFYIPNEEAFSFFMSIYKHAYEDPFPLHAICGSVWKNTLGQVSFLQHAVVAPPEVFTFAHSSRQLAYNDAVYGHKLQIGHTNHAWLCLDLLDVLCQLAERGHFSSVRMMFEYPLKHCPEILLLGVSHVNTACNLLQQEVSSTLFPMVVKSGPSGIILYLWHLNPSLVVRGFVDAHNVDPDCASNILDICQELKILSVVSDMIPFPNGIRLAVLYLWYLNPSLVVREFVDAHNVDPDCASNILDICQELKILSLVLDMIPFRNGIRLAALASRKELVDLENWLTTNISIYKDTFVEECLKFLKEVELGGSQDFPAKSFHHTSSAVNIYLETRSTFMKVLKVHTDSIISNHLSVEMERLSLTVSDSNLRQQNGGPTDSSAPDRLSEDVESEANLYFHQMFSGHLSVDAVVHMLARFKESPVRREQLIFECMIGNIFEEYRFFPKYPERQLKVAAHIFGSVIKHQLVTHLPLGIALRGILDAIRKPPDSKMFVFGINALERFVDRLIEWPQYCNHILQISHLRSTHPEIIASVERALARKSGHLEPEGANNVPAAVNQVLLNQTSTGNGEVSTAITQAGKQLSSTLLAQPRLEIPAEDRHSKIPVGPSNDTQKSTATTSAMLSNLAFTRPSRAVSSTRFGSALNIETLVAAAERRETPIEAPASEIQDKISFIINNISVANVEAKAKEFTELLKDQYYPWFAQYMVMKRASIEPNFHDLYLKFLDKVNSKALTREIVQATYENCKVLLGSELIKSSVEERSLLKNLGSWLGKLTIGRNSVLRAREIDPKSLIIEAYEKGLMIAVIPFTSKILEPCQSSQAYQPPNPWTMGILGLLAEIYSMPNLKMNLKFDIEVLFKNLSVDMKDITPTSLLKNRKREIEGNPDFSNKDVVPQSQIVAEVKSAVISPPNDFVSDVNPYPPAHLSLPDEDKVDHPSAPGAFQPVPSHSPPFSLPTSIPNIATHVIINAKLNNWGLNLHFQRAMPIVMDRAIKEIVSSIVQRSVSIATQTTKELVLKDYAMESDELRIYHAAHLMVASLAGSLAHVTCKEPLRNSISSQLRSALQNLGVGSELLEHAVQIATNDNLDLGCAIIEQAATDKAIQTIDGEIAQPLSLRRKHRDGVGPTFFDANTYTQGSMGVVPEALRPKPGHLSLSQQRVYEDFVRLPWQSQSSQNSHNLPTASSASTVLGFVPLNGVSGQGNVGLEAVSQTLDVAADVTEPNPATLTNLSAVTGPADAVIVQSSENNFFSASFSPTVPATELPVDNSDAVKETLPQAISTSATTDRLSSISEPSLNTRDALDKYEIIAQKLEALVNSDPKEADIQEVAAEVPDIILRCVSRDEAALAVAQKVFKGLYENASNNFHVNACLAILAAIRDVCKLVVKELTSWVIYSDEERKFNKDITIGLIRRELLNLAEYNVHMAKLLDGGRNKGATEFSVSLIQALIVEDSKVVSELHNLVDALAKLAAKPGSPESLQHLIEIVKNPASNLSALSTLAAGKDEKGRQSRDKKVTNQPINREDYANAEPVEPDPAGFRDQVTMQFADWYQICELPGANDVACSRYVVQLHHNGLLKGDDTTDRFFRILMELSVSHCLSSESPQQGKNLSFLAIDIYAKLVFSIFKVDPASNRFLLLSKILAVTVRFIQKDSEEKKISFNPRPYFRLFVNWLLDFVSHDPVTDGANFQILTTFASTFHALQPLKVPAFSFAWLELVSHRSFMPKLLILNGQKGWPYVQRLLVDLFQFLEPFLRSAELGIPVHFLYKGTLRVLLVLLHDFPEFLCDYHFTFCDVIPPSCIQMRNVILSAFPRNMKLPDPSTPNLKIDLLPDIHDPPHILSEVDAALKAKQMKSDVDEFLRTRQSSFLSELKQRLFLSSSEASTAGTRYNVPLINSLVLYSGMQAIQSHAQSTGSASPLAVLLVQQDAAMDIYRTLILELDTEGRYLFLNAVANQLRYPNNHTHYFSFVLLHLFSISDQEIIQEQITRVLLERLIVNRPHPWGLLITFIELIKNPRYNFWNRSFIRCAPEIEKLFESVARSCGGLKPMDESMVSGWVSEGAH